MINAKEILIKHYSTLERHLKITGHVMFYLIVDVAPGKFRPYYLRSKGKEAGCYIRINGTSRPADAEKLKELELEGRNVSFDSLQAIGEKYDEQKALELCHNMKKIAMSACHTKDEMLAVKDMTIEKLEDFGVLCKVGGKLSPANAFGLLTENKNRFARIQCALFKGLTRDIFIDQKVFDGPIYQQISEAYNFVLRHIDMGAKINGIYRSDVYELPNSAIREMIANAVVHRSYLDKSCVQVCIFDDRLEVLSPGGLYGGLDLETIKLGKSKCRNAAIAEAFHYMRLVEAWGTGLPRILSRCVEYGLPAPLFEEFGDSFKVTLFRKVVNAGEKVVNAGEKVVNAGEKVVNAGKKVVNDFKKYRLVLNDIGASGVFIENIGLIYKAGRVAEYFGQGDVQEWLECSKGKAIKLMRLMKDAGIIEKVTGHGAGKYRFRLLQGQR